MITPEIVNEAIRRAPVTAEHLPQLVKEVPGFSTPAIRALVALLCATGEERVRYLEIGAYCGGTAVAAIMAGADCVIYDDFSQSFGRDDVREQLEKNFLRACAAVGHDSHLNLQDAFSHPPNGRQFDVYFYDGLHTRDAQAQALPLMIDYMADTFLFMVDDYAWSDVYEGTAHGFDSLRDQVDVIGFHSIRGARSNDDPVWHNGVGLFLCQKRA